MNRGLLNLGRAGIGVGVAGTALVLAAAPALAAASLTVSPGTTVSSSGTVTANGADSGNSAAVGRSRTLTLVLDTPDGGSKQWSSGSVPATQRATVSGSFDAGSGINGDYTFTLKVNGTTADTSTVAVRIPPAAVSGFAARPSGSVAHFSWAANSEPDLAGYDIVDVTGGGRRDLTPGGVGTNVCSGGTCIVDIDFGSGARGSTRSFVVDAMRYTSPSHSGTVASGDSSSATVTFPAPPSPQPSPSGPSSPASGGSGGGSGSSTGSGGTGAGSQGGGGTGGGTTSGGSGGATSGSSGGGAVTGGSGGAVGADRGISSTHASAALKAYLPTFSAGAAPALPSVVTEVKPLPQGTYKPTLAYPDQVVGQTVHKGGTAAMAHVRDEVVRVLNVGAIWKSLGGAALLLLVAAHLRAWVAGIEQD
jgi:hypothetical protein